ncbi:hypothetical protein F0Q45_07900 [Mycobacterium simiae]|uniref:Uncharacterized protein n=1 Tax=Mycobacterium simiae TaxID=1784 RepID=A0A5B1BTW2_MYCSI|nr:hypothetical protein [Mycobacterium simiae]KAA1250744.1 hypothetical protein F0Q45_07900 [Mycobacterium simiae]
MGPAADGVGSSNRRIHVRFTPAKLKAFVAAPEEGSRSAASPRLHVNDDRPHRRGWCNQVGGLGRDRFWCASRPCAVAAEHPATRVIPRYLPLAARLAALRHGELDLSFMDEHPAGAEFDTTLLAREALGVPRS